MKRYHYHIGANVEGYLPETDPYITTSRREAERALASMAREYRDAGDIDDNGKWIPDYTVSGSASSGDIWCTPRHTNYPLDTHLWLTGCNDKDCGGEFDG